MKMITCPQYLLVLFVATVNNANLNVLFSFLEDVLKQSGYSNEFCGDLISIFFLFGIPASFLTALLVDYSGYFLISSRIACIVHPIFFTAFSYVIQTGNQHAIIVVCCFLFSGSMGMVVQSLIQVQLRAGIFAESYVMAMSYIILGLVTIIMCSIFKPLRDLSPDDNKNVFPLNTFSLLNITANIIYVFIFRLPNKDKLKRKLESFGGGDNNKKGNSIKVSDPEQPISSTTKQIIPSITTNDRYRKIHREV